MSGKAYANRSPVVDNDLYHTPESLVYKLCEKEKFCKNIWEPACGDMAIVNPLKSLGYNVVSSDLESGSNFLTTPGPKKHDIITNPPFCIWDDFVERAKEVNPKKFAMIGKANYWGTVARDLNGLFYGLKTIYWFNRYVDYRTPRRKDGLFHVGAMCTGWFVWEKGFKGDSVNKRIDVNDYAVLGQYRPEDYEILNFLEISSTWTPALVIDFQYAIKHIEYNYRLRFPDFHKEKIKTVGNLLSSCRKLKVVK